MEVSGLDDQGLHLDLGDLAEAGGDQAHDGADFGRIAAQHLLQTDAPLGQLRGQRHALRDGRLPLVVTYHPAYLLRSPSQKRKVWQDLCLARRIAAEQAA